MPEQVSGNDQRRIPLASKRRRTKQQQRDELRDISSNDDGAIAELVAIRVAEAVDASDLDPKTFALVNIAALIAGGGDEASYVFHVTDALEAGASADEVTAVLTSVGPNVGVFKMVAAADPLATALGIGLAVESGDSDSSDDG
jgi:alkylhydroperoxidase/carboxymuconolactone decarboxylase family protein YurZ